MKIIHNIIRVIASLFSVALASIYLLDLLSIFDIDYIVKGIVVIILSIFEILTISILTTIFKKIVNKKPIWAFLPFLIILYSASFYMTVNGAEILANKQLSYPTNPTNQILVENIPLSKINQLQIKIDSLNAVMPDWKSGRDLQQVKIKSYQEQIAFWQKEFSKSEETKNTNIIETKNENKHKSKRYYYIASIIMIFVFVLNFYYVFMYKSNKQTITKEDLNKKKPKKILTDKEILDLIIQKKSEGITQKEISKIIGIPEYKISRILTKNKKNENNPIRSQKEV